MSFNSRDIHNYDKIHILSMRVRPYARKCKLHIPRSFTFRKIFTSRCENIRLNPWKCGLFNIDHSQMWKISHSQYESIRPIPKIQTSHSITIHSQQCKNTQPWCEIVRLNPQKCRHLNTHVRKLTLILWKC